MRPSNQRGKSVSAFIPFSSPVTDTITMCRSGDLICTFQVAGIPFETVDDDDLDIRADQFNTFLRTLASNDYALTVHRVRRSIQDRLENCSSPAFARQLSSDYNNLVGGERLMATELYVTLIERDLTKLNTRRTPTEIRETLAERIEAFEQKCNNVLSSLARYNPTVLGTYIKDGIKYSSALSFYEFLLTGRWHPVRVPTQPIYEVLGGVQIFTSSDILQLQTPEGNLFAQSIELKDYAEGTYSGILDDLLYPQISGVGTPHYPFIETQTFAFLSRNEGIKQLKLQQRQLLSSKDAGESQIIAMNAALDGIANGTFVMGEYSYSLVILGEDADTVRQNTLNASKKLADAGFIPFISTRALSGAFFSQLPDNFAYRPRIAKLTSMNFAHLTSLHNFPCGKRNGNPWGEALALMLTPSGAPYYFNFHTSPVGENSFDKKTLANTTIIGSSGVGKTASINFLLTLAQKYRDSDHKLTTIYFDKDRGAEIAIRALDGGYLTIKNGQPTGFNPFQLDSTPENINFLNRLMKLILRMDGLPISPADENKLANAIKTVMSLDKNQRRMALLIQAMTEGTTREEINASINKRLAKWIGIGSHAWVFDNPVDTLDFDRYPNFGIDGTDFLDNAEIRSPIAYYLLYRLESILDGRRIFFVMDEFWKWLLDNDFEDFAKNKLKTIRKQNGFGVFATQSPSDVLKSPIAAAVIEQSATQIFLPNPKATASDYIDGFKLTQNEFQIVKSLAEDSRMMLVKQGHNSVICKLDLSPFSNLLKVLSGSTDSVNLVTQYRALLGDSPSAWLPYFLGQKVLPNPAVLDD